MKKIQIMLLSVAVFAASACSDWTETESVGINQPSLEEQNPELYASYMKALRNYKNSDHKVMFVSIVNGVEAPSHRNEHLTNVPDSVDFVALSNPEYVSPELMDEMSIVREKGTRVIYNINYDAMEKLWKKILEEQEADKEPETPDARAEDGEITEPEVSLEERFLAFSKAQTELELSYCNQFGFDGVKFSYTGKALLGLKEEELAILTKRQEIYFLAIKEWHAKNSDKLIFFKGLAQNLVDNSILDQCKYIVVPAYDAASAAKLSYLILNSAVDGIPLNRFVVGVTTPSMTDPTSTVGYFTGFDDDGKSKLYATKGAAKWVNIQSAQFSKAGISILDAQNDYYNIKLIYKNIRESIDIMNPAPKK